MHRKAVPTHQVTDCRDRKAVFAGTKAACDDWVVGYEKATERDPGRSRFVVETRVSRCAVIVGKVQA